MTYKPGRVGKTGRPDVICHRMPQTSLAGQAGAGVRGTALQVKDPVPPGITALPNRVMSTERSTEKLDVRVSSSAKAKLQAAASVSHRSMSDFVMESALSRAEETLAGRHI